MMNNKFYCKNVALVCFFLFFPISFYYSQTKTNKEKWEINIVRQNEDVLEVDFRLHIPNEYYVYDKISQIEGLDSVIFQVENVSQKWVSILHKQLHTKKIYDSVFKKNQVSVLTKSNVWRVAIKKMHPSPVNHIKGKIVYNKSDGEFFLPEEYDFFVEDKSMKNSNISVQLLREKIDVNHPKIFLNKVGNSVEKKNTNLLKIFLLGLVSGLIALVTPCVFPMIPLTVSFFTKYSKKKTIGTQAAIFYSFSIFSIYLMLSVPFHFLDSISPEILNNISTSAPLNVIFFIIFIAFAFSLFGYYEISLPSKWISTVDKKSSVMNYSGIFFMALTLTIVSFSCTGPILGSLLASSLTSDGGAWQLTAGMSGFGLALALPFGLLSIFPGLLNKLPKSGSWLEIVKITFGFMELGLAFKFLSNADLVEHWGILKREIFLFIWIIVTIGFLLYILGIIRLPHQTKFKRFSTFRIVSSVVALVIIIYLSLGLGHSKYSNLSLISGFPPPMFYSIRQNTSDCALNLDCEKDYFKGLERAKKENKPLLLDFTGWACVNCRKMEENVWIDDEIYSLIRDQFILVSLYVDDRKKLPIEEQFEFVDSNKKSLIETIGDKWSKFETVNFKNNSQPLYAIISPQEELLINTVSYLPDVKQYKAWLELGLKSFQTENTQNSYEENAQ